MEVLNPLPLDSSTWPEEAWSNIIGIAANVTGGSIDAVEAARQYVLHTFGAAVAHAWQARMLHSLPNIGAWQLPACPSAESLFAPIGLSEAEQAWKELQEALRRLQNAEAVLNNAPSDLDKCCRGLLRTHLQVPFTLGASGC
jgi:hypothetical protein